MKTVQSMLAEAQAAVPMISPQEAQALVGKSDVLFLDVREPPEVASTDRQLTLAEIKSITPTTLMSSGVGIVAGIIPGLGPTVASFLSYALAKRWAKPHERFGEGEIKGVAAAETADNAVIPASLIPLFALGLPGSVSAAIIIAAFTVHGVTPGPRMFEQHGRLMYGIYGAMIVASLLMLGFGVVGWVMHRYDYSRITFLIGFVVGPLFELSLRQSLIITHSDPVRLLQHPAALLVLLCAVVVAVYFTRSPREGAGG